MTKLLTLPLVASGFLCPHLTSAQASNDSLSVFTLGEVVVHAKKTGSLSSIQSARIEAFQKLNAATALNLLPGITQSNVGPRNESMVFVRGYDLRQTPVYIDGIPVYVPYDGYVDLARFTTFGISKIQVEKDGASVLYGPNSMGGAINLISAKPTHRLELNGGAGWLTGGHESYLNAGIRLNKFYFQANASQYKRDYCNLSKDFVPTKTEDGDRRDNSYNNDWKYGFKIGFQPNAKNEYAIGYTNQHGSKGTPVYTGTDTLNSLYKSPRYWQWPKWNKQSVYFISNTSINSRSNFSTRIFYDQFINVLKSFDNAQYTTQTKPYAFTSYYNDYSVGASAVYGYRVAEKNNLNAAVHFKQDVHRENNEGEPVRKMSDNTYSMGITDKQTFNNHWSVEAGASFNQRESLTAQNYNSTTKVVSDFPSNNNSAVNLQGKLTYDVTANRSLVLSANRMTRFATMKDRYSYRMGTAVPNPDLHAEHAFNSSLQYEDNTLPNLSLHAAVFYSRLNDVIQTVNNAYHDTTNSKWLAQAQNTGRAEFYGMEMAVKYNFLQHFSSGVNYSFIKRKNLDKPTLRFTDVPEHKVTGWLQYARSSYYVLLNAEYNSDRYSTSYGTKAPDFFLLNASAALKPLSWASLQAGVNNIFDKNYMLSEGYPEQGRNYFVKLLFNYQYK